MYLQVIKSESKADLRIVVIKGMVSFEGVRMLPAKLLQSCLTLCDPIGCNPLGSSVHRIFQARILEWVACSFSRRSSPPRDRTRGCINLHSYHQCKRVPSPAFIVCRLFDGHSDKCEVIPHCSFELHFSNIEPREHLHMFVGRL